MAPLSLVSWALKSVSPVAYCLFADDGAASRRDRRCVGVGETAPVVGAVVHDRDVLLAERGHAVVRESFALHRVGHADAPDVAAQRGDVGIGGRRRDHGQTGSLILGCGGDGGAGEHVSVDDDDGAVVDELLGHEHGLFRVAEVVPEFGRDLTAVDAAGGVQLGHGDVGARLVGRAVGRIVAGEGSGEADLERCGGRARVVARAAAAARNECHRRERDGQRGEEGERQLPGSVAHGFLP